MILETERLFLREMTQEDFLSLCNILQDGEVMYAYEGAFTDAEVQEWLDRQLSRYGKWNYGLWAVILKETGEFIGQCGLTRQPWKDDEVLEVGYLFAKKFWHQGYATEAAKGCMEYAFNVLKEKEVCSIIRDTNIASQNVATRNGMVKRDSWIKHYRGMGMLHYRYVVHFTDAQGISIREVTNKRDYLPLLLLADEQEDMINMYLDRGTMFVAEENGAAVAECVVTDEGDGILEIQNLAVAEEYQGRGIGRKLIEFVADRYRNEYKVLQVGTGDSPLTVPFYEHCGFEHHRVIKNYIVDHYDHPIYEAGKQLIDKVYLRMKLRGC